MTEARAQVGIPPGPIRVAHVVDWLRSGIGNLVADLARQSDGRKLIHHVIAFEAEPQDTRQFEALAGVDVLRMRSGGFSALRRLHGRLHDLDPDVIHTHSFLPRLCVRLVAPRKIAHVTTIHTAYSYLSSSAWRSRIKRSIERWSLKRVDRLVCVSTGVLKGLPANWPTAVVVENGIDVSRTQQLATERLEVNTDFRQNGPLLVSVGRLAPEKGYDLLIEALALVRKEIPASLVLVGEGPERRSLQQLSRRHGVMEAIRFVGFLPNPFPLIRQADLFISSSRFEGFSLAQLEAMSLGVPIVTTRTTGVAEVISHGETGFLAWESTAQSLATATLEALADPAALARVAERGRALATRYDFSGTCKEYEQLYAEVVA